MSVAQLERGLRDLARHLYDGEATRERQRGFLEKRRTIRNGAA